MGNNLDKQYLDLVQDILDNGVKKTDRTGTGTLSVFGRQIRHKMSEGMPVLTTKKIAWNSMVVELLWFMKGRTDLKYLLDHDCKIWVGDAYKAYEKWFWDNLSAKSDTSGKLTQEQFVYNIKNDPNFSNNFGELGPIYGKQWRAWEKHVWDKIDFDTRIEYVDQIQNLINDLKTNPDSRRLMVSAWNVDDLDAMKLPPCHYGFQVYTRELTWEEQVQWVMKNTDVEWENLYIVEEVTKETTPKRAISLMWNQRSVDTPLGLPFNLASYGLLLSIIAKEVKMIPDELIANLGDTHIYLNQIDGVQEQLGKELSLEERRSMVTQEMFNMVYNGGDPSSLSNREIDQWGIPRRLERKPYDLPKLVCLDEYHYLMDEDIPFSEKIDKFRPEFFKLQDYKFHPSIKFPLSN